MAKQTKTICAADHVPQKSYTTYTCVQSICHFTKPPLLLEIHPCTQIFGETQGIIGPFKWSTTAAAPCLFRITSLTGSSSATAFRNQPRVMKRPIVGVIGTYVILPRFSGLEQKDFHDGFSDQTLLGWQRKHACWFWRRVSLWTTLERFMPDNSQKGTVYLHRHKIIEECIKTGVVNTAKTHQHRIYLFIRVRTLCGQASQKGVGGGLGDSDGAGLFHSSLL